MTDAPTPEEVEVTDNSSGASTPTPEEAPVTTAVWGGGSLKNPSLRT